MPAAAERPLRVAVVGSGLAGLSAAWLLGHGDSGAVEVELYESAPSLGMGTHSVKLTDRTVVDIPPRFVVPSYYTELQQLYKAIGVPFYMSSGDGAFQVTGADQRCYFRFGNFRMFGMSLPYVLAAPWSRVALRIICDLVRFRWRARRDLASGSLIGKSFGEYLSEGYSADFGEKFAVPMLCVVCTCSPAAVRAYPADTLVEYWMCWALRGDGLHRADGGTQAVVTALSASLSECHLGTRVTSMAPDASGQGTVITDSKGRVRTFDHVILATQAKFAAELMEVCPCLPFLFCSAADLQTHAFQTSHAEIGACLTCPRRAGIPGAGKGQRPYRGGGQRPTEPGVHTV